MHDGSTVYSAEIEQARDLMGADSLSRTTDGDFWHVEWSLSDAEWPIPSVSCPLPA